MAASVKNNRERAKLKPASSRPSLSETPRQPSLARFEAKSSQTLVLVVGSTLALAVLAWAYWPTLGELIRHWNRDPDYTHGYIVPLVSIFFIWRRRDSFPGIANDSSLLGKYGGLILGCGLLLASLAVRMGGALIYLDAANGWSLPLFVGGAVCLLFGVKVFAWSSPAIVFLWFMTPLPYSLERQFSVPLQHIATAISTGMMQIIGLPAIADGHTILLGKERLEVAEACSGLRIFTAILALAVAYVILTRRSWWEKLILLATTIPVAIVANCMRIVSTGLLLEWVHDGGEAAKRFSHDFAGLVMIPFAAGLFWLCLLYLSKLFPAAEEIDVRRLVQEQLA